MRNVLRQFQPRLPQEKRMWSIINGDFLFNGQIYASRNWTKEKFFTEVKKARDFINSSPYPQVKLIALQIEPGIARDLWRVRAITQSNLERSVSLIDKRTDDRVYERRITLNIEIDQELLEVHIRDIAIDFYHYQFRIQGHPKGIQSFQEIPEEPALFWQ